MAKDLTAALQALTEEANGQTSRVDRALPAAKPATTIPARSGSSGPISGVGVGGIASPLTENSYTSRTYWNDVTTTSTDGIFTLVESPIKSMSFTDANGGPLVINYAEPT